MARSRAAQQSVKGEGKFNVENEICSQENKNFD